MPLDGTELAHSRHTPIAEIEREIRWEHRLINMGVARYHEIAREQATAETGPGKRIMREIMPGLTAAILRDQEEALAALGDQGRGRPSEWWWLVTLLPAEKLAFITLTAALRFRPTEATTNRAVRDVAKVIGSSVKDQLDFEAWATSEERETKAAKEAGTSRVNLLRVLETRYPNTSPKVWSRWKAKHRIVTEAPWSLETKIDLGGRLIDRLVDTGKDWFRLVKASLSPTKTELHLVLSPEAVAALLDMQEKEALMQPQRCPMICPPKPWVYVTSRKKGQP